MILPRTSSRTALVTLFAALAGCAHQVPSPAVVEPSIEPPAEVSLGEGLASFYGQGFEGKATASGEPFKAQALTAAHKTLPFGTCVHVELQNGGRSIDVRVNDRGPYVQGRIIDLSEGAARALGIVDSGVAPVRLSPCH